jgi:hypothetical protein
MSAVLIGLAVAGTAVSFIGAQRGRRAQRAAAASRAKAARSQAFEIQRRFEFNKEIFKEDKEKALNNEIRRFEGNVQGSNMTYLLEIERLANRQLQIEQREVDYTIDTLLNESQNIEISARQQDSAAKLQTFGNLFMNFAQIAQQTSNIRDSGSRGRTSNQRSGFSSPSNNPGPGARQNRISGNQR